MSFILRQAAHCDVCGHEWLTAKVPSHCAKCKSRKWNQEHDFLACRVHRCRKCVAQSRSDAARVVLGSLSPKKRNALMNGDWPGHNPKTCRIYKCGMCEAAKQP